MADAVVVADYVGDDTFPGRSRGVTVLTFVTGHALTGRLLFTCHLRRRGHGLLGLRLLRAAVLVVTGHLIHHLAFALSGCDDS